MSSHRPIDLLLPMIRRLPRPVCLSCNIADEKPEANPARVQGLRKGRSETPLHPLHEAKAI
jgi:hypothetical protein